jgi:inhibitor of cysteine peptidase
VSNVSNPVQIANYTIGDRGSDSPVLRDHKAFLFDRQRNLLVIPALVAQIDRNEYPGEIPPYAYGKPVWQGALVFNVTLEQGFLLRGGITHTETTAEIQNWNYYVQRSLYIEDTLYTVSNVKVKMNDLQDLAPINEITVG